MRVRTLLATFAAVAAVVVARPAAAQRAILQVAEAQLIDIRPVATFDVAIARHRGAPARFTVADSAGQLVGTMQLVGDRAARPLTVTVEGADIVLRGDTPRGIVEFVLYGQNERPARRAIYGRWTIGEEQGELRGSLRGRLPNAAALD